MARSAAMVVAALTAIALVIGLGGCSVLPSHKLTVTADFTDAAGLFVGNDVGVLGVSVGKVTKIEPEGDHVRVTMKVDNDQPIPAGAAAAIVSRSVATDRYVELTPVYQGGPKMQSGAVIPMDRTRTPVEFDKVLSSLGDFARDISGSKGSKDAVSKFLAAQAKGVRGKGRLINQSIHSLADASNGISAQRTQATSTLVALDKLTGTLATNQKTVREFVKQVSSATSLLANERTNFRTALRTATKSIRVVAQFARKNRKEIKHAVDNTNYTMRTVLKHKSQTAEILRELPLTLENLQMMERKDGLLAVRLDITGLLPILGPVLKTLCEGPLNDACTLVGLDPAGLATLLSGLIGGGS
jgi:virulence factor Mce-like protein